jgi:EAL domain-containing protein (putative c-di-GMP-specific phosphodiesterase class I)
VTAEPSMTLAGKPVLEYQPAVDLATGRLLGMEALVRWEHPTKGRIAPDILIPWAEENGDIVALNAWVMEAACCEAQLWSTGLQLAVNCSMIQLRRGEASKAAKRALETSGLNPDRLTIEVTERTINDDRAAADLRALADLGVHLAVDDVGTSWSSLQVLRKFAIEIVKIDRAFINNLEAEEGMNRAIVEAIIHVGHSLAMSTVAEGVESAQQAAILREFGADVGQGYFFARPLCGEEAHELATAEPRPIFSLGPGRESSASAAIVQRPVVGVAVSNGSSAPIPSFSGGSADPFSELFPPTLEPSVPPVPPVVPFTSASAMDGMTEGTSEFASYMTEPAKVSVPPTASATFGPLTGDSELNRASQGIPRAPGSMPPARPAAPEGLRSLGLDLGIPELGGHGQEPARYGQLSHDSAIPQAPPAQAPADRAEPDRRPDMPGEVA